MDLTDYDIAVLRQEAEGAIAFDRPYVVAPWQVLTLLRMYEEALESAAVEDE